jgi:hypothetical protein
MQGLVFFSHDKYPDLMATDILMNLMELKGYMQGTSRGSTGDLVLFLVMELMCRSEYFAASC